MRKRFMSRETGPIFGFSGEFAFLSNVYPVDVTQAGNICRSVEHAYQAE